MPTARSLLYGGVSMTETPLDRDPRTETPWTKTPLDRDPPGQRSPWTETTWTETPLDRDRDPPCGQTDTCENSLRKLDLRTITRHLASLSMWQLGYH